MDSQEKANKNVDILVSGPLWKKEWPYYSRICKTFENTQKHLFIGMYSFTEQKIYEAIKGVIEKGDITVDFILNKSESNSDILVEKLWKLEKEFVNFNFKILKKDKTLHSKVIISDYEKVIIGSANLTHSGMFNNYEMGLMIKDKNLASRVLQFFRTIKGFK